jgi:hypothetical protein
MPTVSSNGTQTAVIGTEHTLFNPVTNKFFTAYIDLANMAANDIVEIRVSVIAKAAGAYRQYDIQTYADVQLNPLVYIAPLPSDIGYKITLKQTAGTARTYDWKVYEV